MANSVQITCAPRAVGDNHPFTPTSLPRQPTPRGLRHERDAGAVARGKLFSNFMRNERRMQEVEVEVEVLAYLERDIPDDEL